MRKEDAKALVPGTLATEERERHIKTIPKQNKTKQNKTKQNKNKNKNKTNQINKTTNQEERNPREKETQPHKATHGLQSERKKGTEATHTHREREREREYYQCLDLPTD